MLNINREPSINAYLVRRFRRPALVRLHPALAVVARVRRQAAAPAAHALAVAGAQHAAGAPAPAGGVVADLKRVNARRGGKVNEKKG